MGYSFSRSIYSPSLLFHYIVRSLDPSTISDTSNFSSETPNPGLSDLHHTGAAAASDDLQKAKSLCSLKLAKFLHSSCTSCKTLYCDLYKGHYLIAFVFVIKEMLCLS